MPRHWLYRVLENDDDGDPLDFGMVSATNGPEADGKVRRYLQDALEMKGVTVRLYEQEQHDGVWQSIGRVRTINVD